MNMNRRQFLRNGAALGSGLVIGFELDGCGERKFPASQSDSFQPSSFLEISPGGEYILQLTRAEMGQGVYTGLTTLVAEELDIDPAKITVVLAPVTRSLGYQATGGSNSIRSTFESLRQVGANAKAVLLAAAAKDWNVPAAQLIAENGAIHDTKSQRKADYSALVATAKTLPVPQQAPLKSPAQFKLIGLFDQRLDAPQKVDGRAVYGIDIHRENMAYAVLVRCPHFGGTVKNVDASASRQISGVSDIFTLGKDAIVIVANSYWVAHKASRTLQIEWDGGALADLNSESIRAMLQKQLAGSNGHNVSLEGAAMAGATQILEAEYFAPYQAHAPMEPPNCVAAVATDRVDIWCGNQSPDALQHVIASALQRPRETVFIHSQLIGGSFGRRLYYDYAVEAALVSQRIGKPVKLIWSREDDIRHDLYRPAALSRFRAQLREGKLIGWENKIAGPSGKQDVLPAIAERIVAHLPDSVARSINEHFAAHKFSSADGATQLLYAIPYLKVDFIECNPGVPFGAWRSVGNSVNGFFVESFIDEIAQTLQQDPLAFRLSQLKPEATRARAVLELVGDKSHWGKVAAGHYQGIAVFEAFDTVVAEVAEISIEDAQIKVHKVTCAIDCGRVVNPDIVKAQIESGVIFALSAALTCEITIENGAVAQSNFHDFEPIRMHNAPAVEVHIIPSEASPTGVGEPGVPPLAAAVGNAIFAATGKRLRELPFRL